jgi:hypothetical protein
MNAGSATVAVSSARPSSFSFIEALTNASSDAVQAPNAASAQSQSRSNARSGERGNGKSGIIPAAVLEGALQSAAELLPVPIEQTPVQILSAEAQNEKTGDAATPVTISADASESGSAARTIPADSSVGSQQPQSIFHPVVQQPIDPSEQASKQLVQPIAQPSVNVATIAKVQPSLNPALVRSVPTDARPSTDSVPFANIQTPLKQVRSESTQTVPQPSQNVASIAKAQATSIPTPVQAVQDGLGFAATTIAAAVASMLTANTVPSDSAADSKLPQVIGDSSRLAAPSVTNKSANTQFSIKSDTTVATGTNKTGVVEGPSSSSKGNQTNGQSAQHSQPNASAANVNAVKSADGNSASTVSFQTHVAIHEGVSSGSASARGEVGRSLSSEGSARAADDVKSGEPAFIPGINAARLIQTMNESEMRVGMHSNEFGDISIRTSVSQQQILTQISVAHGDLGTAISAHIPSLQDKLGNEFGLHASIEVNQGGASMAGGGGQASQREQKPFTSSSAAASVATGIEIDPSILKGSLGAGEAYRLDIRA